MERYVDKFVQEHPKGENENLADYLDRFLCWMVETGRVAWDEPIEILPNGEVSGKGGEAVKKALGRSDA